MLLSLWKNFILAVGKIVGKGICITKGNRDWLKKTNKTLRTFLVPWNHNGLVQHCWGLKDVMFLAGPVLNVRCHPLAQKLQLRCLRAPQGCRVNLCLLSPWMMQDRSFSKAADSSCCVGKRVMAPLPLPSESQEFSLTETGWKAQTEAERRELHPRNQTSVPLPSSLPSQRSEHLRNALCKRFYLQLARNDHRLESPVQLPLDLLHLPQRQRWHFTEPGLPKGRISCTLGCWWLPELIRQDFFHSLMWKPELSMTPRCRSVVCGLGEERKKYIYWYNYRKTSWGDSGGVCGLSRRIPRFLVSTAVLRLSQVNLQSHPPGWKKSNFEGLKLKSSILVSWFSW